MLRRIWKRAKTSTKLEIITYNMRRTHRPNQFDATTTKQRLKRDKQFCAIEYVISLSMLWVFENEHSALLIWQLMLALDYFITYQMINLNFVILSTCHYTTTQHIILTYAAPDIFGSKRKRIRLADGNCTLGPIELAQMHQQKPIAWSNHSIRMTKYRANGQPFWVIIRQKEERWRD